MAGPNAGSGLLYNATATTSGVVTAPVSAHQYFMASFQTRTDGTQTLTVDIQVTNVETLSGNHGINRDDSFASADWVTVASNTMTAAAQSRMDVVGYLPHKAARVRLTSGAGTPSVKVYISMQGNE